MGRVYKAVHPDIGSRVAVKVLSRDCADKRDLVERFFSEARAANLIRHESIVNVLDLSTLPDGRPYIIMEYLDGLPLADIFERRGQLPLGSLARLAGEVLDALGAAHAKSIVHRDLKPDNIYVSPQGHATVLDFGIAKLMPEMSGRSAPTRTGSLLGTPHYMAPEQAMAQPVDARTDIYSTGVILYEGATGKKPFAAESLFELLRQVVDDLPAEPRTLRPDLPLDYQAVIMKAVAKNPDERFQSAGELAQALAHVTSTLPGEAWAPIALTGKPSARIGPPSVPTPSPSQPGLPPASLPVAQIGSYPATLPAGQNRSRAGMWIGLGLIGAAAIAGGVVLAMSGDTGHSETAVAVAADAEPLPTGPATGTATDELANPTPAPTPAAAATPAPAPATPAPAPVTKPAPARAPVPTPTPTPTPPPPAEAAPPPDNSPPKSLNRKGHDISAYLPKALVKARAIYSDAVLIRIDASGVYPNGRADLTLDSSFSVLYRFASPSRSKRPADLPQGVDHKANCKIYVNVSQGGIQTYPLEGWACDEPLIGAPRCSVAQVWKKAARDGAPSKNAVASVGYWAGPNKRGRWHLSVGSAFSKWIADDC